MRKLLLLIAGMFMGNAGAYCQQTAEATFAKFTQVTSMFSGKQPYSCTAILEVKYKGTASNAGGDTSLLIYKGGSTYYKSSLVEHVEASEGELIINHELKSATFQISDSLKTALQKKLNIKRDPELEAMLDPDAKKSDMEAFSKYVVKECNASWTTKDGLEEIVFTPKRPDNSDILSMKIRFDKDNKVRYYEYINRDVYAKDMQGRGRFRVMRTIYDNFQYENVPDIPSTLHDFLQWNGWAIKLKKYTNYKLSVL